LAKVAGVKVDTTGPSARELSGSAGTAPVLDDWLQVTVVLPTTKSAVVPGTSAAVYACPAGVTVVPSAASARAAGSATVPGGDQQGHPGVAGRPPKWSWRAETTI
jgi:hypothetical protein